jgi:non-ribosomal peptide synthetase component F
MLQLFTSEAEPSRCSSLRFVMAGGEALPPSVIGAFYQRFPECFLCNCYGPTEASIGATMWPCSRAAGLTEVPIGKPLSNMRIHVLDAALQPVPPGKQGEICIEGSLAEGYLNRPELTHERFVTLPGKPATRVYRTGDRGAFRADGSLRYLGRIDNQVKVRGMRVELEEVEHAVNQHPSVAQSLASVDRDRFGTRG